MVFVNSLHALDFFRISSVPSFLTPIFFISLHIHNMLFKSEWCWWPRFIKIQQKKRRKQTSWTKMKRKWKKLMNERLFIFYFCCLLYNKGMWIRFGWMEYLCAVWDSSWMLWMGLRVSNLLRIFVLKILRIFCWDFYLQLELLDNLIEEIFKNFYKNFWQ